MSQNKSLSFKNTLKISALTFLGSLISLTFVPLMLLLFVIFYIMSCCAVLLNKFQYGEKALKANGIDVLSGKETEASYPIINIAFRFTGKLNVDKMRKSFLDLVTNRYDENGNQKYKRMRQIYIKSFGYYIWKDTHQFDINQHVKIMKREDIGLNDSDQHEWETVMKKFLNKFGGERIQNGIPQWELLLLEENEQRYTAIFRFHHSIADGIYASRMLCEAFLQSPAKLLHSYVPPSTVTKIMLNLWSFSLFPFGLWKILKNNDKNVLHGPRLCGKKMYYVSKPISMAVLRKIRKKTNVSVHGVLFSCLSAALASHFKRRETITKEINALIPMPLQNLQKPLELKNRYTVLSLKIPTTPQCCDNDQISSNKTRHEKIDAESLSPLERLEALKTVIEEAKGDPTFLSVHFLMTSFCSFLPAKLAESLLSTKGSSIAFSNVPGPQEILHFEGDQLDEVMFWIPDREPLGTAVSILSYNGQLRAGLSLDKSLLKDDREGDLLIQAFENEIGHILQNLHKEEGSASNTQSDVEELLKHFP